MKQIYVSWLWVVGCVVVGFGIGYFVFDLQPAAQASNVHRFEIATGNGMDEIAVQLKESGLIRSPKAFKLFSLLSGSAHLLKPGTYFLNAASSTPAIVRKLISGPNEIIAVVITEGMTLRDIDELLARNRIIPRGSLLALSSKSFVEDFPFLQGVASLEGYLFPDTYQFFSSSTPGIVVRKLLNTFAAKAWPLLESQNNSYQKLILASLLEKEVPNYQDRRVVAGILFERLRLGIALQVDATISYIKCQGAFVFCDQPGVARKDLDIGSLYNTYLHPGVPPGPISNPGTDAILAVLEPRTSDFLYYLSDPVSKKTIFSRTLDEHNENRVRYLNL
ncbi:MAG TPA: endolytic transglycosylase MltG [Candidatus Paceibacterota bacterium]